MKKNVIFFFTYRGEKNEGQRMMLKHYSIFTRKNTILKDFMKYIKSNIEEVNIEHDDSVFITNVKIIGL